MAAGECLAAAGECLAAAGECLAAAGECLAMPSGGGDGNGRTAMSGDNYTTLDPGHINTTIELLHKRIVDRFPDSGLSNVCTRLLEIGRQAERRAAWIAKPIYPLRVATWALSAVIVVLVVSGFVLTRMPHEQFETGEFIQVLEAGLSELALLGAGIFFLVSLEQRIKRHRALAAIHELRVVAHIIDMHQLTKDPERTTQRYLITPWSPRQSLTHFELRRYLDYCTELLSLTGKVAALYVQKFDDEVALESASEVEALVTSLSRKIWQKIMILYSFETGEQGSPLVTGPTR